MRKRKPNADSLFPKKIISKEVSDKSKVALEIARADLANANNTYNNMIITAPFDGYVGVVVSFGSSP